MFQEQSRMELPFSLTILFNFYAHARDKETKETILKRIEGIVDYCFACNGGRDAASPSPIQQQRNSAT